VTELNITMLPMVNRINRARDEQVALLNAVEQGGEDKLIVSIDGVRQDAAMAAVARPAVIAELRGRLASLDRDLEAMGVKVD
jgi:hypothetical protein